MDAFAALAAPTRRAIVEMLAARGELTASAISSQFDATPSAISQHLKILREAKLVVVEKRAQQRVYTVDRRTIDAITTWATQVSARFDRFNAVLQREKTKGETS
jgi:DNA-binding transcriptional ArsR family regulator